MEDQQEHEDEIRSSDIKSYLTGYSTTQAEIRWVLNLVCSKYSWNSSTDSGELLGIMFPDSDIVKSFKCGPLKLHILLILV